MSCRCIMVVNCSRCCHRRIPRSVVAVVFAPSVIVSSATDPPRPPSPRSSPTIGASGKPWTTTMTARPRRASRTSTASRHLLRARCPCSSQSSSLPFSSSQNALPKVSGGQPPRNHARTPPASALLPCFCILIVMEIHIIQVGQKGLALLRKCVPEQQKGDKH